jgi:O-antigen ligase
MFLLTLGLRRDERRRLGVTILVLAVVSIILGVLQLLGGSASPLRLYQVTTSDSPVGVFANINHQVSFILCALPFAAVVAAEFASGSDRSKRSGGLIMALAFALFLTAGIALCGSVAGYALFVPSAFASLLIYRRATVGRLSALWKAALGLLVTLFIGLAILGPVSQQSLSSKFSAAPDSRRHIAATTAEAITDSFPIGTGLGTFADVYRHYEDPQRVTREYTNRAHNDYLELALETGFVGVLTTILFVFWWLRRSITAWRSEAAGTHLARAGSLVIGIVLLHSLVDYPIRTSAIAAVFAVACAFLVPSPAGAARRRSSRSSGDEPLHHLEAEA